MERLQIFEQRRIMIRVMLLAVRSHGWMGNDALENKLELLQGGELRSPCTWTIIEAEGQGENAGDTREFTGMKWQAGATRDRQKGKDRHQEMTLRFQAWVKQGVQRDKAWGRKWCAQVRMHWVWGPSEPWNEMPSRCLMYGDISYKCAISIIHLQPDLSKLINYWRSIVFQQKDSPPYKSINNRAL